MRSEKATTTGRSELTLVISFSNARRVRIKLSLNFLIVQYSLRVHAPTEAEGPQARAAKDVMDERGEYAGHVGK